MTARQPDPAEAVLAAARRYGEAWESLRFGESLHRQGGFEPTRESREKYAADLALFDAALIFWRETKKEQP